MVDIIYLFSCYVLFRAKHRKDVRYEETRGDWYFQRKHHLKHEESQYPSHFTKGDDYKENKKSALTKKLIWFENEMYQY